jgi:hypothetical protein
MIHNLTFNSGLTKVSLTTDTELVIAACHTLSSSFPLFYAWCYELLYSQTKLDNTTGTYKLKQSEDIWLIILNK